jgi:hypothetical protein
MTSFIMNFIQERQQAYPDFTPLCDDPDTYRLVRDAIKVNLEDPDKINYTVKNYDLFPVTDGPWSDFIDLLRFYKRFYTE